MKTITDHLRKQKAAMPHIHHKMKKLKITNEAFIAELQKVTGSEKIGWSGTDHDKLIDGLMARLKDASGYRVEVSTKLETRIKSIIRPTPERQVVLLRQVFAEEGMQMDKSTDEVIALICEMAAFSAFLVKTNNPMTGKPFIVKEKKNKKTKIFAKLFEATASEPDATAPEPEAKATEPEIITSDGKASSKDTDEVDVEVLPPTPTEVIGKKAASATR